MGLAGLLVAGMYHTGYGAASSAQQLGFVSPKTAASWQRLQLRLLPLGAGVAVLTVAGFYGLLFSVSTLRNFEYATFGL